MGMLVYMPLNACSCGQFRYILLKRKREERGLWGAHSTACADGGNAVQ